MLLRHRVLEHDQQGIDHNFMPWQKSSINKIKMGNFSLHIHYIGEDR
jgi:hypothetical protein